MRRRRVGWCVVLGAVLASGLFAGAVGAAPARVGPTDGEWLFLQESSRATLRPLGSHRFRLRLIGPDQRVEAFADRPARRFDFLSLSGFIRSWTTYGFKRVPPNAAIERQRGGGKHDVLIVELSKPKLDRRGGVSYLARPLRGQGPADLRSFSRRADQSLPRRLGPITLFIDDADDSQVVFTLGIQPTVPQLWVANMNLSAPVVLSANSTEAFNYSQTGSSFQASLTNGGSASITWFVDPTGDCVYVSGQQLTGSASLTGQAQVGSSVGPSVAVNFPQTGVPLNSQSSCESS